MKKASVGTGVPIKKPKIRALRSTKEPAIGKSEGLKRASLPHKQKPAAKLTKPSKKFIP